MTDVFSALSSASNANWLTLWMIFAGFGVAQITLSYLICTPLERRAPLLHWSSRQPMKADIAYTFIVRLIIFPLVAYFEYAALYKLSNGWLDMHRITMLPLSFPVPAFPGQTVWAFAVNFIVLDFADYWRHRLSHRFGWWYGLHSLHHAELQMTFWSDDRSHILEDVVTYVWLMLVALLIGVPPLQFPFVILGFRLVGSVAHANTTASYGWVGERLLVSPQFHRAHHCPAIAGRKSCNFGTALPWWDVAFRTAIFTHSARETGDPSAGPVLATGSWWQQQAAGVKRMVQLARRHS